MHCIDGYGPAVFSDGISCADCSKHRHLWILSLLFQLTMVTPMCLAFIPLQIKGTSSPLNIIITYVQLVAVVSKFSVGVRKDYCVMPVSHLQILLVLWQACGTWTFFI